MKTLKQTIKNISNVTGEFKDQELEQKFQTYILQESIHYSRRYVLAFGIAFLLFIIPDYFYVKNTDKIPVILFIRFLFFIISVYYSLRVIHVKKVLHSFSTVYELIIISVFWIIFSFYSNPNIAIHYQILIIFILAIFFTIPNGFLNKLFLTFFLASGFFYIAANRGMFLSSNCSWDMCFITIIILIFCSLIVRNINKLQRIQFIDTQALERLSSTDALTGALNRRKYDLDLENEIYLAKRYGLPFSAIMLDLDNFKKINDKYGHILGDKVLEQLSSYIRTIIRKSDQLYRWGGEEFIILLTNTGLQPAYHLAERVRKYSHKADIPPIKAISCSFGVATWKEGESADSFTKRLDRLLYKAKESGKDCIVTDAEADNQNLFSEEERNFD